MGPALDSRNRKMFTILLSLLSFLVILTFLQAVYSLLLNLYRSPAARAYFTLHGATIAREGWWTAVNMALSIAIFYVRKADDDKDMLVVMKKENAFYQLRYLRSQLNPHFLFNTLNSIYSLALQKSDKAPEVVVKLADIMRYLIYECNEEKIPLNKEIEFIRNYIEIERLRYQADIRLTVEGFTDDIMIEPFLFISFIENGFKHALDNSFSEPFIYITLKIEPGQIVLNVINSTNADLETQAKQRMSGKGIANSSSLLELLYPDAYQLDKPVLVVLVTAYAEYAVESYEFSVIGYLLKPISFERFSNAVNKIEDGRVFSLTGKEEEKVHEDHIFIKSNSKFFKVNFSEIV